MPIEDSGHSALSRTMHGKEMLQLDEVAAMLRLHELGWGAKRLVMRLIVCRRSVCSWASLPVWIFGIGSAPM